MTLVLPSRTMSFAGEGDQVHVIWSTAPVVLLTSIKPHGVTMGEEHFSYQDEFNASVYHVVSQLSTHDPALIASYCHVSDCWLGQDYLTQLMFLCYLGGNGVLFHLKAIPADMKLISEMFQSKNIDWGLRGMTSTSQYSLFPSSLR